MKRKELTKNIYDAFKVGLSVYIKLFQRFNPLTAGVAYIRVFIFFISTLSTTF